MTTAEPTEQRGPLRWVDGTMPALQERVLDIPVVGFIEYCLRGVGQVVFMNSPITGLLILVAAWTYDPWFGFAGTIGVIASTLAGIALGFDRGAIHAGLYGFNGVLVGLGLALFLDPPWDALVIVWIIVLSALSSVLMGALAAVFGGAWGVPPFTLPFNITTLLFLVTALNIAFGRLSALVEPALPAVNGPDVSVSLRETADATGSTDAMAILNAIFRGIGQLFFLNSILAGVLIIIGIAFCSRIAAGFALVG
jgi:urea transporter